MTAPDWLMKAALQSGESSGTLAAVFRNYCESESVTRDTLARRLGCSPDVLDWMSLCYRPDEAQFGAHIEQIATRFQVDPKKLAAIVRHVDVMDVMRQQPSRAKGPRSLLVAARDRKSHKKGRKKRGRRA